MGQEDRIDDLNMSMRTVIGKLSEGNPGAIRVLTELLDRDFMAVLLCDTKRLYGEQIWNLYKDVCGEDIGRFLYHLQIELPNQETGQLSVTGPWAPAFNDNVFWNARSHAKPGSFWALEKPPGNGYRYPLNSDGSEPDAASLW